MVAFNTLLLSIFAKNVRFGPDVKSSLRRNQTLATIYLCIACCFKIILSEGALRFLLPIADPPILSTFAILASISGLYLLRTGKSHLGVIVILAYLHLTTFTISFYFDQATAALYCLFPILQVAFFVTSSTKIRIINTLFCFLQAIYNISNILAGLGEYLTKEEFRSVSTIIVGVSLNLALGTIGCAVQRFMEANIVEVAEANYTRSENLNKELVQAIDAQEKFVFSLNHEIRNSLNSMSGSIDYLLGAVKNLTHLKVLRNAKLSTEILMNLVSNILDAARLKSDKIEVTYRVASIDKIIKKALTINSENLKAAEIIAESNIDRNVPRKIWTDPTKLLQIIMNLISNALKFTPKGGRIYLNVIWESDNQNRDILLKPIHLKYKNESLSIRQTHSSTNFVSPQKLRAAKIDPKVFEEFTQVQQTSHTDNFKSMRNFKTKALTELNSLSESCIEDKSFIIHRADSSEYILSDVSSQEELTTSKKGYLKIEVMDTGSGIDTENMPKLFAMFSQGHRNVISTNRGTGLGLWICKQICETMGGDISVYSQVGKGTKFVFYIPVNNEGLDEQLPVQVRLQSRMVKALVVDDYAFNRDLHKLLLEKEGVHVTLASDGKEAFELYKDKGEDYFNFVMTDVQMPVMDGFTSAKKMREWEKEKNAKKVDIYFISGEYYNEDEVMADFKTREKINEATNIWCLRKPIDVARLKEIVATYQKKI